ncbi:MAG TPA: hypothetical protein VKV37_13580 [Ktedonobacteraceae bacterium]|nr:hypothetical protein [Ktedonobacteraceae bacterium]
MSIQPLEGANELSNNRPAALVQTSARILAVAIGYTIISRLIGLLTGPHPSLSLAYLQALIIDLITGAVYALVLLPLARRLPYRMGMRTVALFLPLYWIAVLGNLVEAFFYTTMSRLALIAAIIILGIPCLVASWLIAWLLPAHNQKQPAPGIGQILRSRPLLSWLWRIVVVGILYSLFIQIFGSLLALGKYYTNSAYTSQLHTTTQPTSITLLEEAIRGVIFALVLLPLLAVMRGRSWSKLLALALYVMLIDAAFESWLAMLAQTSWTIAFRLGEGANLTLDAIVRGIIVALFLALPALTDKLEHADVRQELSEGQRLQ